MKTTNSYKTRNMDYDDCLAMSKTRKRKLANNTYLITDNSPKSFSIRLHATDIITFYADGRIQLDSGGWKTVTTKDRIDEFCSGVDIWQSGGIWYCKISRGRKPKTVIFADKMIVGKYGGVKGASADIGKKEKQIKKLRRDCRKYAKAYVEKLFNGEIDKPSMGDCWGCLMTTDNGKTPLGGSDHIRSHIAEKYYVPSLLLRAIEHFPISAVAKNILYRIWHGETRPGLTLLEAIDSDRGFSAIAKEQIEKSIYRFCLRELNQAT